jgi:SAM-dependent methyltransferase
MAVSYDGFAPHFDAWQRAFGSAYDDLILPRLLDALARHGAGRRVADLGAGTGDLVMALAARGYRVVAVDRSAAMLERARVKVHGAALAEPPRFVLQDLRALRLDAPVDTVVCVYTVINQLTGEGDLARAFAAVAANLVPAGMFLFEVNLPAAYARYWSGTETTHLDDAVVVRTHRRLSGAPLIEAEVTIRRDGGEEMHDRIEQRLYSDAEIETALVAAGFVLVERDTYDPFGDAVATKALWVARRA